jgi:hypothetical protein
MANKNPNDGFYEDLPYVERVEPGFRIDPDDLNTGPAPNDNKGKPPKPPLKIPRPLSLAGKAVAAAALGYATLPIWGQPAAAAGAGYLLWKNRALLMPRSIKGFLFKGGLLFAASYIALNALSDRATTGQSFDRTLWSNGTYATQKGMNKLGEFSAETGAPCINAPGDCVVAATGSALDAVGPILKSGAGTAWDFYTDNNKAFYRWHFNQLTGGSDAPATQDDDVLPAAPAKSLKETLADKKLASQTTQVEICKHNHANNVLRKAAPENWTLMQSYWDVMTPKLETMKQDPNSTVGRALADAMKTGKTVVIVFPAIETYIERYNQLKDEGKISSINQFNQAVAAIDPSSTHVLNIAAYTKGRSQTSLCPKGEQWMTNKSYITGYREPIRYNIKDFVKNKPS